jgi:ribosomal protein L29
MGTYENLSDEQVVHAALSREREMVAARFQHSQNSLDNTAELGGIRKEIARLKTEARTRELAHDLGKGELFQKYRGTYKLGEAPVVEEAPKKGGFLSGIVDKLTGKE